MSITDELRKYVADNELFHITPSVATYLLSIADRIDAEHEKALTEMHDAAYDEGYDYGWIGTDDWLERHEEEMVKQGWMRLPKDADGKLIRIGDMMECMLDGAKMVLPVGYMTYRTDGWHIALTIEESYKYQSYFPKELHHSNDTWEHIVEDAKRLGFTDPDNERLTSRLVARCKALAGDDK